MKQIDRDALKEWEALKQSIYNDTPIDETMSPAQIEKHRLYLEAHPIEWMKFFFPKYAKYPFAPFQKRAIHRIINNPEWYEVLSWSRSLAKSTITMFAVLYLTLTGRKSTVILASATEKAAARLLAPYRANLESNRRIIQYYGEQMSVGEWAELEFRTRQGVAFYGVGAGNAPRGARNEAIRPDVLLVDDFDTDEDCRNPDVLNNKWDWWEHALYPTRDPSGSLLVIFCGNIIAEDCCIVRAGAMADHHDIVNIRDAEGRSTWPEKNTEELIDRALSKISTQAQQAEYFNNPVVEGKIFGPRKWGKIPDLRRFPFLCIYADPTQSEAKGAAKNKQGSLKAVWLLGKLDRVLYVIKGFLGKMTTEEFVTHFFSLYLYARAGGCRAIYAVQENNSLQDPFFQQAIMLIVDANDPDRVRSILENDIEQTSERHQEVIAMYERGSNAAPAFGMIGTLIGLINMLKNLSDSDMETLGPSMSVALITTFYGSLLAHVLFNPIASNLTARDEEEILCRQIIVEGIMAIQSGENPKFLRERLMTFMNQKLREGGESGGGTGEKKERKRRKEK